MSSGIAAKTLGQLRDERLEKYNKLLNLRFDFILGENITGKKLKEIHDKFMAILEDYKVIGGHKGPTHLEIK